MSIKKQSEHLKEVATTYRLRDRLPDHITRHKGRGANINPVTRFEQVSSKKIDDGWNSLDRVEDYWETQLLADKTRTIINKVTSPDIPFDRTINPYRGCEHGCVYCYARPTHAYFGFSPGLDFETKIIYKPEAAKLLRRELNAKNYSCAAIAIGSNTDPYQPAERKLKITRQILEVLLEAQHPLGIVTKSALITRDFDILTTMAQRDLVHVLVSITTLDSDLAHSIEPRATAPHRRLEILQHLKKARIPCGVMIAPIIPFINDMELENIMQMAYEYGAQTAGTVFLRLPHEVKEIFTSWLFDKYPLKAKRVMARIMDSRAGKLNDKEFHKRMRGQGNYAQLIQKRFHIKKQAIPFSGMPSLRCDLFVPPNLDQNQGMLF